jgi:dTDP-D-glucose 4,6-dehydratase
LNKIIYNYNKDADIEKYLDLSYSRIGQDIRYALNDSKLKSLGWKPTMKFDEQILKIINYYRNKFIW